MAEGWEVLERNGRWQHRQFVVRERRLTLGRQYYIETPDRRPLGYCKQKMFRLREDIRIYGDTAQREEVLQLRAVKILDFNANFEVIDPTSGEHLGFLRRKGWTSIVRDEWHITDAQGRPVATLKEDSLGMALVRRLLGNIIPTKYHVALDARGPDHVGAVIQERFQLFGDTFDVFIRDEGLDPRVIVALTVLMDAVEKSRE